MDVVRLEREPERAGPLDVSREDARVHWVALAAAAGVGGRTITRLLQHFGSLEQVFTAGDDRLLAIPGVGQRTAAAIRAVSLTAVEADMARWAAEGIETLTWEDPGYPANLLRSPLAPPVLFVRGELLPADARAVAIVGTRQPGPAEAQLARQMGLEFSRHGWTVVSGLALGIDAAAHRGALEAGGRTLAVLGSGLNCLYPSRHAALAGQIAGQGAVLSELSPEAAVSRQALIARNRITSGLCRAVIVVQSRADSGSANTAKWAWRQGRAVFAMAGEPAGNAALIAAGAEPIAPEGEDWDALSARLEQAEIREPVEEPSQPRLF
ncbi:MAG TPA: DNA-processing protein DprA [Aggregatilineales bacterium]|nr:DNA-processing protein DprA [Aggregatilineales bacterium]